MQKYDASIIDAFAADLYSRAGTIVAISTVMYGAIGLAAGYFAFKGMGATLGVLLGAGLGFYLGQQKAFILKLQAQTALCQAQIERNTRSNGQEARVTEAASATEPAQRVAPAMGTCSSCKARVPVNSTTCPNCMASFGPGSAWQVMP